MDPRVWIGGSPAPGDGDGLRKVSRKMIDETTTVS
jgi:hypothetical protein